MKWLLLLLFACDTSYTVGDGPPNLCGSLFPALRIESACAGELRVTIDNRDVPPNPRTITVDGATLIPWPPWVRVGMPSVVHVGAAVQAFSAEPYTCQVVAVSCM